MEGWVIAVSRTRLFVGVVAAVLALGPRLAAAQTTAGVVTTQQIAELRLSGRNFMQLATFNWVNLGSPNTTILANNGTRNATAGTIASTATAARQVQLGIQFMF